MEKRKLTKIESRASTLMATTPLTSQPAKQGRGRRHELQASAAVHFPEAGSGTANDRSNRRRIGLPSQALLPDALPNELYQPHSPAKELEDDLASVQFVSSPQPEAQAYDEIQQQQEYGLYTFNSFGALDRDAKPQEDSAGRAKQSPRQANIPNSANDVKGEQVQSLNQSRQPSGLDILEIALEQQYQELEKEASKETQPRQASNVRLSFLISPKLAKENEILSKKIPKRENIASKTNTDQDLPISTKDQAPIPGQSQRQAESQSSKSLTHSPSKKVVIQRVAPPPLQLLQRHSSMESQETLPPAPAQQIVIATLNKKRSNRQSKQTLNASMSDQRLEIKKSTSQAVLHHPKTKSELENTSLDHYQIRQTRSLKKLPGIPSRASNKVRDEKSSQKFANVDLGQDLGSFKDLEIQSKTSDVKVESNKGSQQAQLMEQKALTQAIRKYAEPDLQSNTKQQLFTAIIKNQTEGSQDSPSGQMAPGQLKTPSQFQISKQNANFVKQIEQLLTSLDQTHQFSSTEFRSRLVRFKKYQEDKQKLTNGDPRPELPISINNRKAEQPVLGQVHNQQSSRNTKAQSKKKEEDESTGEQELQGFLEQHNEELILNSRFGKITPSIVQLQVQEQQQQNKHQHQRLKPWQRKVDGSGTRSSSSSPGIAKGSPGNKGAPAAAKSIPADVRGRPPGKGGISANNLDPTNRQKTFNPGASLKSINTNSITADHHLIKPKFHQDPSGLIQNLNKKQQTQNKMVKQACIRQLDGITTAIQSKFLYKEVTIQHIQEENNYHNKDVFKVQFDRGQGSAKGASGERAAQVFYRNVQKQLQLPKQIVERQQQYLGAQKNNQNQNVVGVGAIASGELVNTAQTLTSGLGSGIRESVKDSIVTMKLTPKVKVVQSRISYNGVNRSPRANNQEAKEPDTKPSLFDLDLRKAQASYARNIFSKGGTLNIQSSKLKTKLNSVRPAEALRLVKEASTLQKQQTVSRPQNDDFEHSERSIDNLLDPRKQQEKKHDAFDLTNSDYGTMHLNPHDRVRILGGEASGARPTSASKSAKNSTMQISHHREHEQEVGECKTPFRRKDGNKTNRMQDRVINLPEIRSRNKLENIRTKEHQPQSLERLDMRISGRSNSVFGNYPTSQLNTLAPEIAVKAKSPSKSTKKQPSLAERTKSQVKFGSNREESPFDTMAIHEILNSNFYKERRTLQRIETKKQLAMLLEYRQTLIQAAKEFAEKQQVRIQERRGNEQDLQNKILQLLQNQQRIEALHLLLGKPGLDVNQNSIKETLALKAKQQLGQGKRTWRTSSQIHLSDGSHSIQRLSSNLSIVDDAGSPNRRQLFADSSKFVLAPFQAQRSPISQISQVEWNSKSERSKSASNSKEGGHEQEYEDPNRTMTLAMAKQADGEEQQRQGLPQIQQVGYDRFNALRVETKLTLPARGHGRSGDAAGGMNGRFRQRQQRIEVAAGEQRSPQNQTRTTFEPGRDTASQLARSRGPANQQIITSPSMHGEVGNDDDEDNQSPDIHTSYLQGDGAINVVTGAAQSNSSGGEASDLADSQPRLYQTQSLGSQKQEAESKTKKSQEKMSGQQQQNADYQIKTNKKEKEKMKQPNVEYNTDLDLQSAKGTLQPMQQHSSKVAMAPGGLLQQESAPETQRPASPAKSAVKHVLRSPKRPAKRAALHLASVQLQPLPGLSAGASQGQVEKEKGYHLVQEEEVDLASPEKFAATTLENEASATLAASHQSLLIEEDVDDGDNGGANKINGQADLHKGNTITARVRSQLRNTDRHHGQELLPKAKPSASKGIRQQALGPDHEKTAIQPLGRDQRRNLPLDTPSARPMHLRNVHSLSRKLSVPRSLAAIAAITGSIQPSSPSKQKRSQPLRALSTFDHYRKHEPASQSSLVMTPMQQQYITKMQKAEQKQHKLHHHPSSPRRRSLINDFPFLSHQHHGLAPNPLQDQRSELISMNHRAPNTKLQLLLQKRGYLEQSRVRDNQMYNEI